MAGYVVDHLETGVRYAVSERNFNPAVHKKVRPLKHDESVLAYQPKPRKEVVGTSVPPAKTTPKPAVRKPRKETA